MRDAGGQLAERSELFGLHQPILRGAEFLNRQRKLFSSLLHLLEQADILNGDRCLVRERRYQFNLLLGKRPDFSSGKCKDTNRSAFPKHWNAEDGAEVSPF